VLFIPPAGFQFFVNLTRRLLERERGGGDAGGLLFAVALVNGVFARVELAAHGERLLARIRNRDFGIDAEARVAALTCYRAGKSQRPLAARLSRGQQQPRYLAV
jgi:hypothetical protein